MALSEVRFLIADGGLGIALDGDDHVSALVFGMAAPVAFGTKKIKEYSDLVQAVADGIVKGDATYGEVYYQLSEFWRMNAGATCYVCFNLTDLATEIYAASSGRVRQVGFFTTDLDNGISAAQTAANTLIGKYAPAHFVVAYTPTGGSFDVTTLPDLTTKNSKDVSVLVAGSHTGEGAALAAGLGRLYVPSIGAVVGAVSKAKVHENIGWIERFPFNTATELAEARLLDGVTDTTDATYDAVITSLDTKRYIVFRKYAGYAGVFIEKDHTATLASSDYSNIRNNRTMGKALRGIRSSLLPKLKSPLYVDSTTGKLDADTVEYFKALAGSKLSQMLKDGELSGYGVLIDPNQNILSTSVLNIKVRLVPVGSANELKVTMQFAATANFQ